MNAWLETLGVLLLAGLGAAFAAWFSRLPRHWWLTGYLVALVMIFLYALGTRVPTLSFTPPISWMMAGRNKFAATGFIATLALTTPLLKLPLRRDRYFVGILAVVIVLSLSAWPFLAPVFNHARLAAMATSVDDNGVCRQNTEYTCGPAAAVTALRKLGFKAEEGEIAILAHTSSAIGTPPDVLANALREKYGRDGLVCEYRAFKNISDLKDAGLVLAVIKFNFMVDHYVTILDVNDHGILVGDPLTGRTTISPADFAAQWRYVGVVVSRK